MAPRIPINFEIFYSFNYFEERKKINCLFEVITFISFYIIAITTFCKLSNEIPKHGCHYRNFILVLTKHIYVVCSEK